VHRLMRDLGRALSGTHMSERTARRSSPSPTDLTTEDGVAWWRVRAGLGNPLFPSAARRWGAAEERLLLDKGVGAVITNRAKSAGVTAAAYVLAAFGYALSGQTGRRELWLATPLDHSLFDGVDAFGKHTDLLPLPFRGEGSFQDVLSHVSKDLADAIQHATDITFADIVKGWRAARSDWSGLVQTSCQLDQDDVQPTFRGIRYSHLPLFSQESRSR